MQGQKISLYIICGVPEDFEFKTRTRKEISVGTIISLDIYIVYTGYRKSNGSDLPSFRHGNYPSKLPTNFIWWPRLSGERSHLYLLASSNAVTAH
jgi:hypothetical protein